MRSRKMQQMTGVGHYQSVVPPEYWGQTESVFDASARQGVSGYTSHWGPPQGVFRHSHRGFGATSPSQASLDCAIQGGTWSASTGMCAPPTGAQTAWRATKWALGLAAGGALIYHGYKRHNGSVGWGLVWGLLGGIVWPITLPIAYAQGFGKPKKA